MPPQVPACDRCTQGVMDETNPHLLGTCSCSCHEPRPPALELRYHVPRSQVWAGSRGGQSGNVHLHTLEPFERGRLRRGRGRAVCGRDGWYERSLERSELERLPAGACARCLELAARYGLELPAELAAPAVGAPAA